MPNLIPEDLDKAAQRGEPSHVWRAGQERRFAMLKNAAGERLNGRVLVDGSGVGIYLSHLVPISGKVVGFDIEMPRVQDCRVFSPNTYCAAGEHIPIPKILLTWSSVTKCLEHVQDDQLAIQEMVRVLKPGGRIVLLPQPRLSL